MKETQHHPTESDGSGAVRHRGIPAICSLAVGLALSATACGGDSSPTKAASPSSDTPQQSAPAADVPSDTTAPSTAEDTGEVTPMEADAHCTNDPSRTPSSAAGGGGAAGAVGSGGDRNGPTARAGAGGGGGDASFDDAGRGGATDAGGREAGGGEPPIGPSYCAEAGGVCVGLGECDEQGGTVADAASDCHFDDGSAECCVPSAPQPDGTTCEELGGVCTSVGGCLQADGYFALPEISCEGGVGVACCVAHESCGDADIDCCYGGAIFNPACDDGQFVCAVGEAYPRGTCPL